MKILIVEDDQATANLLSKTLSDNYYTVDLATDGMTGLEFAQGWEYDLILLDVELPKLNGIQVCREIRNQSKKTPILMLTVKENDQDVIAGLDAGADDYVTKPCNLEQLLARIRSLLRRSTDPASSILKWGELQLDPAIGRVTYRDQEIPLRRKQYALLELFLRYPQRIFSRSVIIDHLWTVDNFPSENAVTNLMKDLRQSLTNAGITDDLFETIYGLGYRLRVLPNQSKQSITPMDETLVEMPEMAELLERFQASIQRGLATLEAVAQQLLAGQRDEEVWHLAKSEAHRLAGSLGMYGYDRASEIARSLDRLLAKTMSAKTMSPDSSEAKQFMQGLTELQQETGQATTSVAKLPKLPARPLVLVISDDDDWAEALQQEAETWNLRVEVIPDWSLAQQQFVRETPVAIALDSGALVNEDVLHQITQRYSRLPVLTLAAADTLSNRVAASRAGSVRYLTKPMTAAQFFETVTQLVPVPDTLDRAKVLVVDDDVTVHPIVAQLLQPWGLEVVSLDNPEHFWQVLTTAKPDLVLVDIEMPTFSGVELCRVVRQDPQYGDLPIIAITAHTEMEYIRQVFDAGADDLIHKPVIDSELVTRVINRLERLRLRQQVDYLRQQQSQLWHQQSRVDSLTKIANRRAFDEFLQYTWQQHLAERSPLALILCDIDEFKLYNDRYGHLAGDNCLRQLARTLQQCIRPAVDQVARYGGEEFAIILPDTTLSGAVNVAERIQQAIAHLAIPHANAATRPHITLTVGITGSASTANPSANPSIDQLLLMAERALYAAKSNGRDTYCLYPL